MRTAIWSIATILLVSLSMGMAFCHLMEMPARRAYDPALWSQVTNIEGTYRMFGPPLGAAIEGAAWLFPVVLAFLVRHKRSDLLMTGIGAALMVTAHVSWWLFVFPVNTEMVNWRPDQLPADFTALRDQWEFAHAGRALLQIAALTFLVASATLLRGRPPAASSSARGDRAARMGGDARA